MADKLIHSQAGYMPKILPREGPVIEANINRAQDLTPNTTPEYQEVNELGRGTPVDSVAMGIDSGGSLTQLEHGSMSIFCHLANKPLNTETIDISDFDASAFGVQAYLKDTDGDSVGSVYYPGQRLESFSVNVPSPEDFIDRSFSFVGDETLLLSGDNKYLIPLMKVVESGEEGELDLTFGVGELENYPVPVENTREPGQYVLSAVRIRNNVTDDLGDNLSASVYEYNDGTITIHDAEVGDRYKFYVTASEYITGVEPWVPNDTDVAAIAGHSVVVYFGTDTRLYRLQDVNFDVSLSRADYKEIGNHLTVERATDERTVTVTLGRILKDYDLENLLVDGTGGIVDLNDLSTDFTLTVVVYDSHRHNNFKMAYQARGLHCSGMEPASASVEQIVNAGNTFEGSQLIITKNFAELNLSI